LQDFGVEVDASPTGYVCSGSLKGFPKEGAVRKVMTGDRPLRKLLSKEQQLLFAEDAPDGVSLDDLSTLGPLLILKLKNTPEDFERKLVTELWLYFLAEHTDETGLFLDLPERALLVAFARLRLALRQRPVVVLRPVNEKQLGLAVGAGPCEPPAARTSRFAVNSVIRPG
jgi:hypothetical protein